MMKFSSRCLIFALSLSLFSAGAEDNLKKFFPRSLAPVKAEKISGNAVKIVSGGKADAVIVLPEKKVPFSHTVYVAPQRAYSEMYRKSDGELAAEELQYWIAKVTGATLPIVKEVPAGKSAIILDYDEKLPPEGFRITAQDNKVLISGALPGVGGWRDNGIHALLFGAYDFLERFCGVRFYYPGDDGVFFRPAKDLIIPALTYQDAPVLNRRHLSGAIGKRGVFPGKFPNEVQHMLRLRNGGNGAIGANRSFCHTPYDLIKQPGAVKSTPGSGRNPAMPCYLSPGTQQAFMQSIADYYAGKKPAAWNIGYGVPGKELIPFSPPDTPLTCRCKLCAPYLDLKAPYYAQSSRLYAKIITKMANDLKTAYPGKLLYILPYYNFVEAPKDLKLPDNVIAQVALMFGHSLWHDPVLRRTSMRWITSWQRITGKKVYIYSYPMWPGAKSFPMQYYRNLSAFMRDIAPHIQGFRLDSLHNWNREFFNLYCHYKLMWDPDFDVNAAEAEFLDNFYGPAGSEMKELFTLLTDICGRFTSAKEPKILNIGPYRAGEITREKLYEIIPDADWKKLESLILAAEKAVVPGSVEERRVKFFHEGMKKALMEKSVSARGFTEKSIKLTALPAAPAIDGKADAMWDALPSYSLVKAMPSHVPDPLWPTEFKAGYFNQRIYFFLKMTEPAVDRINCKKPAWSGDNVEIFLEFTPGRVYQFIVNAENNVSDAAHGGRFVNRRGIPAWRAAKGDGFWTMEIAFPISTLGNDWKFDPKTPWKANVTRYRYNKDGNSERSRFSTRYKNHNSDRSAFVPLIFPAAK